MTLSLSRAINKLGGSDLVARRSWGMMCLNYFEPQIDNSAVRGMKNKVKIVSHRCYGFRTLMTCLTALYHGLANPPEPPLVHKFM